MAVVCVSEGDAWVQLCLSRCRARRAPQCAVGGRLLGVYNERTTATRDRSGDGRQLL